jgi:hypothetical protein
MEPVLSFADADADADIPKEGATSYCGCPMVLLQRSSSQTSKNTDD